MIGLKALAGLSMPTSLDSIVLPCCGGRKSCCGRCCARDQRQAAADMKVELTPDSHSRSDEGVAGAHVGVDGGAAKAEAQAQPVDVHVHVDVVGVNPGIGD